VDVAHFPGEENAGKQRNGEAHPQGECIRHFFGFLRSRCTTAHHEKQGGTQAAENGHKGNDYKVRHGQDYLVNARFKWVVLTFATVVAIGITLSLGGWQLSRAAQKQALQAAVLAQGSKPVLDGVALQSAADPLGLVHQRVRLTGTWVPGATVLLDNRPMDGRVGFFAMTPLLLQGSKAAILVQRGWVPRNFEDRTRLPRLETPAGVVEIEGRIAPPPAKLYELGGASGGAIRQNLDLAQFRTETGLALMAVTLQQTGAPSEGLLRDWAAAHVGVDRHYGYAFQWFGLAALIAVLYFWFQIVRRFIYRPKDTSLHG